ncbi:hypothetical protein MY3296_000364 [Beauveria thailandica]
MAMTAAQSEFVADHDEAKFPVSSFKRNAVAVPDTVTAPAAKRHCARVARHDQRGSCNAALMSLDGAMRADCRRRLYVHPIAWTPHHLELLGVHFHKSKPLRRQRVGDAQAGSDAKDEQARTAGFPWDVEDSLRAIECMVGWGKDLQRIAMTALLRSFGLSRLGDWGRIEMQFRGETVCRLEARHKWVHGGKGRGGQNYGAGLVVRRKKEKALQPIRAYRDPYICSLLIALAQAHRKLAPDAPCWKVLLLAVPGVGAQQLYCYQGWVPAALLRRLDEPSATVACLDVAIRISTISLMTPRNAARRVWESEERSGIQEEVAVRLLVEFTRYVLQCCLEQPSAAQIEVRPRIERWSSTAAVGSASSSG